MQFQNEENIQCPYCWELITVLVDPSLAEQEYVEDCQVCCRPILLHVHCQEEHIEVRPKREND